MRIPEKVKIGMTVLTAAVLCGMSVHMPVHAAQTYQTRYHISASEQEDYTLIVEDLGEYEVCKGDCLWEISEKYLGNGADYIQLFTQNAEMIKDPEIIYPGMCLKLKRNVYVTKRLGANGIKTTQFRHGIPAGYSHGIIDEDKAFSNYAFFSEDTGYVVCLLQDKEQNSLNRLPDWDAGKNIIEAYAEKNYGDRISDLKFHYYTSETGAQPLSGFFSSQRYMLADYVSKSPEQIWMFSYLYTIEGAEYGYEGDLKIHVCEAVCRTEHIQAEFTGFDLDGSICDIVLYMAASFEELQKSGEDVSVNGYNIMLEPSEPWELSGIHNPFVWIEKYYEGIFERISGNSEAKERILDRYSLKQM